jgi:hypothetical protein
MAGEPLTNFGLRKSSLISAVGERRQENVLQEYKRRFTLPFDTSAADKGYQLVVQALARAEEAATGQAPNPDIESDRWKRLTALSLLAVSAASATVHFLTRVKKLVTPSRIALKTAAIVCAIALLGASLYQALPTLGDGAPTSGKVTDRLSPSQPRPATVSAALSSVDAATPQSPRSLGVESISLKPQQPASAPSQPALPDKPTVVRSEVYLPDGTRVDAKTPSVVPSVVRLGAPKPPLLAASAAQTEGASLAVALTAPPEPAKEARRPEPGYYIQVKSDQDPNAAEAERSAVLEKHGGDLGKLALFVRQVDLKEKGLWFRVLAGPSKTRDEAERLCRKMKRSGLSDCVVQQIE